MISNSEREAWAKHREDLEQMSGVIFGLLVISGVVALLVAAAMLLWAQWIGTVLALLQAILAFAVAVFARALGRIVAANFRMLTEISPQSDAGKGTTEV